MPDADESDVLRRFVNGDRDAFEWLYRRFHPDVYRWILRIVRDTAAADDATVDAFWRAYRGRANFDCSRTFGAWMRRIATNAALNQLKAMRARPAQYDGRDIAAPGSGDSDIQRHITRAMNELPPKLKIVATLALVEERPLAEIADALHLPIGTVKSRLFRATRTLRASLSPLGVQR